MKHIELKGLRIPVLTTEQMREVDRLMIEKYNILLIQMMENAGRNLAELIRRYFAKSVYRKHIIAVIGKGNNGGGGLVAARHLYNWGAKITIIQPSEPLHEMAERQRNILENFPLEIMSGRSAYHYLSGGAGDLVIDAVIGYGLSGNPRGWAAEIIESINHLDVPVIALDVPSGLDATTGQIYDPCVQATATLTLALPKTGLISPNSKKVVGSLYLADIGVPDVLYKEIGIHVEPIFIHDTIVKLED